jgi:cytochrome c556
MKRTLAGIALTAMAVLPFSAQAQFAKPEDAIKYRKATFTVMANHFSRIGAVVKGEKPYDKATVEADAAIVDMMAKLPWQAFGPGTDAGDTKAQPDIWKEQDKFKAAADKLQTEAGKLAAASKAGDLNAVKAAFGAVGQSCKACHDEYRKK